MSRSRVASLVCEGPTDVPIFQEIITQTWPEIELVLTLQPVTDEAGKPPPGAHTGWTAVRTWCEQNAAGLENIIRPDIGEDLDVLVIALDVDIAVAAGIVDPPKNETAYDASRLCEKVKDWLRVDGRRKLPPEVIIALPAMATEAWVLAALFRSETRPEHHAKPSELLVARRKLRKNTRGKPAKDLSAYRAFAMRVGAELRRVRTRCAEAERLCDKLQRRRDAAGQGE